MKWFPFFKTGAHTSSKGDAFEATSEKLDKILEMNKGREIPIAIGHPKESSPAWGWVNELKRVGDVLQAKPRQLVSEFEAMVQKGMFKNVSVSLNPDLTIRHIGFLGATPPAIEGLQAEFAASADETIVEFSLSETYAIQDVGSLFQGIRDWIIDKFDLETADRVVSQWRIDNLKTIKPDDTVLAQSSFSKNKEDETMAKTVAELEADLAAERAKTAEFSKTSERAKMLEIELATERKKNQVAEFSAFLTSKEMEKKVSPAMREMLLPIMEFAAAITEPIEFSAPDPTDAKKTVKVKKAPVELVKEFAKQYLPEIITAEELATKGKASAKTGTGAKDAAIAEFSKANPDMSYKEVVLAVSKASPELFKD